MTPNADAENAPEPDIDEELAPSRTMGARPPRRKARRYTLLVILSGKTHRREVFAFVRSVLEVSGDGAKMSVFRLEGPESVRMPALWAAMFTVKSSAVSDVLQAVHSVAINVSMHSDTESARAAMTTYQNGRVEKELKRQGLTHGQAPRERTQAKGKKHKKTEDVKVKRVRSREW